MLLVSKDLQQMSSEAKEIIKDLDQLIDSLNSVAGDTEKEYDILQGFLSFSRQKIGGKTPKISALNADVQKWLTEFETVLSNGQGRFEISQKALCYISILRNLHQRLDNICLLIAD